MLPEREAVRRCQESHGITWQALRKYCLANGYAEKEGTDYLYSRSFVEDICRGWVTKREAMDIMHIKRARFFYWVKENGIETHVIGKVCLVRLVDVGKHRKAA